MRVNIQEALAKVEKKLITELDSSGVWHGELSGSALSTAVAVFALWRLDSEKHQKPISDGVLWLRKNGNNDGGWGYTTLSKSNLSTTLLVWSALSATNPIKPVGDVIERAEHWLLKKTGSLEPNQISRAVVSYYGNDKTFAAPILAMCAVAGKLGTGEKAWKFVPQLPFEFSVVPRSLYKLLSLSVVSYALPALISIGLLRHNKRAGISPIRFFRNLCVKKALSILENIQPSSGGYLEAVPLTGFVAMSLACMGYKNNSIIAKSKEFLLETQRSDGSWPIDSNLATWVTTLSVNALSFSSQPITLEWLLKQQHFERHPYTGAKSGGWAWTNLSGGVPDADDTSGALVALRKLGKDNKQVQNAAISGMQWLIDIQNKDGGIPTFCKGWGKLPFDRSCPDITAHAIRALSVWRDTPGSRQKRNIDASIKKALSYLKTAQREDGSWVPLWFGNQHTPSEENPVYGTAQVVKSLLELRTNSKAIELIISGQNYLSGSQNHDGGWGGGKNSPSSIEETALAITALSQSENAKCKEAIENGAEWLIKKTKNCTEFSPAPIGLYFANLWYYEKLYPVIFSVEAFNAIKV